MENNPLVSVVITTYGRLDFLPSAIESVISQTYKNKEIIVVDDNANNAEIRRGVEFIVGQYNGIELIENQTNLGGSLSRNEGIKAAKGELISFLDDDDTYLPERISKCVEKYIENRDENIGLVYTYCNCVTNKGVKIWEFKNDPQENLLYQQMLGTICATSQWVVPSYVFKNVGMFEDSPCKQDSIMLLKIIGGGYNIVNVKECLSNYTDHDDGRISGYTEKNIQGINNYYRWCKKYFNLLNASQINHVEISFIKELLVKYAFMGKRKEAWCKFCQYIRFSSFSSDYMLFPLQIILGKLNQDILVVKKKLGKIKRLLH